MEYPAYIVVHTKEGYLTHGTIANANDFGEVPAFGFTKDIAYAAIFNKLEEVKSLCDRYMACAWVKESKDSQYTMCYEPSKEVNWDAINSIRQNMWA